MRPAALIAVLLAACDGVPADLGLDEPLCVRGGRFVDEPLPGLSPDDADASGPAITLVETLNNVVRLGQASKVVSGRTSTDAVAVGIAFEGLGGGYWVSPLGPRDPSVGFELTWVLDLSIGWELPLGPNAFEVVAIDEAGNAGRRQRVSVCVRPDLLDNASACDAALAPPAAVLALSWDANVDLDLWLITPDGKRIDSSHPTTIGHAPPITPAELAAPGVGILDRDSNADCHIDGINREAIVWQTPPAPGTYLVYANLADACGHAAVSFRATWYRAQPVDGATRLVEERRQDGRLLAGAANGGRGPGLYLMQLAP